ncbi:hypothetical protein IWQ62_003383 [Dispira parvispora]|uniref:Uncharacterized protein n=1 Tax=Dispira parvispora TaxID=1520584 RepID=A0A9W8E740_9FUNG|nr:hypothetical protein IWQ62_003383 [Dispira parvispora]
MNIETTPETVLLTKLPVSAETNKQAKSDTKPSDPSLTTPAMLLDEGSLTNLAEQLQELYKNDDNAPSSLNIASNAPTNGETGRKRRRNSPLPDSGSPDTNAESQHDLKSLALRGCNSAKLTYLVNQLRQYAPCEKCVVYVNSSEDMDAVSRFLKLLFGAVTWTQKDWHIPGSGYWGIRLYPYDRKVDYKRVAEFTTNDDCRVLVMPTWMTFSGVDLTVASRVYFFSPVFYRSVETQAIRQVHNMRQTRPVHVETLVLRDTLEDTAFSFRGKQFERKNYTFRTANTEQDAIIVSVGKFLTPTWEDTTAVDDFSEPRGRRSTMAELTVARIHIRLHFELDQSLIEIRGN